jgi:nucleoid-associated protein YgaU
VRHVLCAHISRVLALGLLGCALSGVNAMAQDGTQDVAAAARQEKARKAARAEREASSSGADHPDVQSSAAHVYTNEDLQKAQILSAEQRASVEAHKKDAVAAAAAAPPAKPAVTNDSLDASATESLGEVARRYRREKAARGMEQAGKAPAASPFRMELTQPAAEIVSRRALVVVDEADAVKNGVARTRDSRRRRDPFSPSAARAEAGRAGISRGVQSEIAAGLSFPSSANSKTAPIKSMGAAPTGILRNGEARGAVSATVRAPANVNIGPAAEGMITVRAGDSLWRLSRQYSGRGARWREWLGVNSGIGEKRLRPGMRLVSPSGGKHAAWQQKAPGSALRGQKEGGRHQIEGLAGAMSSSVTVQAGDSFWKIAVQRYGDGRQWTCVARANAEWRDVEKIYPGQILMVPAACGK